VATTVKTDLDRIQAVLHDGGVIWTRSELLRWYNDGYGGLLADSQAVRRFLMFDVPPRSVSAGTYEWEKSYAGGTFRKFTKTALAGTQEVTGEWEVETSESVTPTNSANAVTHLWEQAVLAQTIDDHYRFFLPKSHERVVRVAWNDKRIFGISSKELDQTGSRWWQESGEPEFWLLGLDRDMSFEIFEIEASYFQSFSIQGDDFGVARLFSGDRSYGTESTYFANDYAYTNAGDTGSWSTGLGWRFTREASDTDRSNCVFIWEEQMAEGATTFTDSGTICTYAWEYEFVSGAAVVSFAVGMVRVINSPDRQYLPMAYDTGELPQLGTTREFKSSKDAISVLETIIHTREIEEDDAPALIPEKLQKYLRYYVLATAFGRQGEGQNLEMSKHYMGRFNQGAMFLKTLGNLTAQDRNYARGTSPILHRSMPGRPRLPAEYPAFGDY